MIRVTYVGRKSREKSQELPGVCLTPQCYKPRHDGEKRCKACLRERRKAEADWSERRDAKLEGE